jgi:putative membrane protein
MMWWWGDGHMGAAGWVGLAFMILFWIAVIVGLVFLFRYLFSRPYRDWHNYPPADYHGAGPGAPPRSDAMRILEERYARGEIDREEFLQRKADLERKPDKP